MESLKVFSVAHLNIEFNIVCDALLANQSPVIITFDPIGSRDELDQLDLQDICHSYGSPKDPKFDYSSRSDQEALARSLMQVIGAVYIRFSENDRFILFKKPMVLLPSAGWAELQAAKYYQKHGNRNPSTRALVSKTKQFLAHGRSKYFGICLLPNKVMFMDKLPLIVRKHIVRPESFELTFDLAENLVPGQILTKPSPLTRALHPSLPGGKSGSLNCLTDFWSLVIPLIRPEEVADCPSMCWDYHLYENIQSLRAIPARLWDAFLSYLEGKEVESIGDFVSIEEIAEASKKFDSRSECVGQPGRTGKCFYDERAKIKSVFGPYVIFELTIGQRTFIILDSPLYGVALRVFTDFLSAKNWASGYQKDESSVLLRLCHDEKDRWIGQLEKFIQDQTALQLT